jgi:hypothetical protein
MEGPEATGVCADANANAPRAIASVRKIFFIELLFFID